MTSILSMNDQELYEWYEIDHILRRNKSVNNLLKIMELSYTVRTGEPKTIEDRVPSEEQKIFVEYKSRVSLNFWPTVGPVQRVRFGQYMENAMKKGIIHLVENYEMDHSKRPEMILRVTENEKLMGKHGLENLKQGHWLHLYLVPK